MGAKEFKQEVAADVEAAEKALQWLKQRFDSLVANEDGAVSKEELAAKVKETEEADGENIGHLIGQAGFNPLWHTLDQLDTNKDGHISWEEFKAHICGASKMEKVDVALEESAVTQRCFGCC